MFLFSIFFLFNFLTNRNVPSAYSSTIDSFMFFFQGLMKTSKRISSVTAGNSALRLGNLPSLKVIPPKWAKISHHKVAQFCRRLDSRGHELAPISGSQWGGSSDDWRLIFSDFDGYYVEFYYKSHNGLLLLYKYMLTSVFWRLSWPFTYKISK